MYEPEDEIQAWWEGQARLPLRERDWMWWIEVGLSNIVVTVSCLAVVGFLLYGLVVAVSALI